MWGGFCWLLGLWVGLVSMVVAVVVVSATTAVVAGSSPSIYCSWPTLHPCCIFLDPPPSPILGYDFFFVMVGARSNDDGSDN